MLEAWSRSQTVEARRRFRANLILRAASGESHSSIARALGTSVSQVRKWRKRFVRLRLKGLEDRARSGRPRVITAIERARIVSIACKKPSDFEVRRELWSQEAIAAAAVDARKVEAISRSTVQRILEAADLKPHRVRAWCHSNDPRFDEKLRDIVSLYTALPEDEPVLCVDEKSGMQALSHRYKRKAARRGVAGRVDFEYRRNGTTGLFGCFNVRTGAVLGRCCKTRTRPDFLSFLDDIAARFRQERVHLVLDNLSTHTGPVVAEWNARHGDRFVFHYTPTHGSWLNQIELWFGILQRRVLTHADFAAAEELEAAVVRFIADWNELEAHPFRWTYTGEPLRI